MEYNPVIRRLEMLAARVSSLETRVRQQDAKIEQLKLLLEQRYQNQHTQTK